MSKQSLKTKAQNLRRRGRTYSEILKHVPVAKSTLSLWLREVGLSASQRQRITEKKKQAQIKGAMAQRNKRIERQSFLIDKAEKEIGLITKRELWLIGTALYWAEGTKQRERNIAGRVQFSNSDYRMIKLFLKWLDKCLKIPNKNIKFDIYIHESHRNNIDRTITFWSKVTGRPKSSFTRIYFKKNKINTNRYNTGNLYYGLLRVNIASSTDLNRTIAGWIKGLTNNCRLV